MAISNFLLSTTGFDGLRGKGAHHKNSSMCFTRRLSNPSANTSSRKRTYQGFPHKPPGRERFFVYTLQRTSEMVSAVASLAVLCARRPSPPVCLPVAAVLLPPSCLSAPSKAELQRKSSSQSLAVSAPSSFSHTRAAGVAAGPSAVLNLIPPLAARSSRFLEVLFCRWELCLKAGARGISSSPPSSALNAQADVAPEFECKTKSSGVGEEETKALDALHAETYPNLSAQGLYHGSVSRNTF